MSNEILRQFADDKRISKKEKDERILWRKNEVADYEATTYAIFYNNALYLLLMIVLSFFLLSTISSQNVNYVLSVGISSGLVALFSTGTGSK